MLMASGWNLACRHLSSPVARRLIRIKAAWRPVRDAARMQRTEQDMTHPSIEIDAVLVARELQLGVDEFRRLMADGRISVLCERGTGEDAGHYRASFYHGTRRARLVVDANGRPRRD
jgi:hypothetical protein